MGAPFHCDFNSSTAMMMVGVFLLAFTWAEAVVSARNHKRLPSSAFNDPRETNNKRSIKSTVLFIVSRFQNFQIITSSHHHIITSSNHHIDFFHFLSSFGKVQ